MAKQGESKGARSKWPARMEAFVINIAAGIVCAGGVMVMGAMAAWLYSHLNLLAGCATGFVAGAFMLYAFSKPKKKSPAEAIIIFLIGLVALLFALFGETKPNF